MPGLLLDRLKGFVWLFKVAHFISFWPLRQRKGPRAIRRRSIRFYLWNRFPRFISHLWRRWMSMCTRTLRSKLAGIIINTAKAPSWGPTVPRYFHTNNTTLALRYAF